MPYGTKKSRGECNERSNCRGCGESGEIYWEARVTKINNLRIREARIRKGYTLKEAGRAAKCSASWVSELERSNRPEWRDLRILAAAYELPVSYFLCEDNEAEADQLPEILGQRSKLRLSETAQRRLLIRLRDNLAIVEELEEITDNRWKAAAFPVWQDSETTAEAVRKEVCPEAKNLESITKILEAYQVLVIDLDFAGESFSAAEQQFLCVSIRTNNRYVVGIRQSIRGVARRQLLAEQLGMIIMSAAEVPVQERAAASFGRHLLLPGRLLKEYYQPGGVTGMNVIDLLGLFFGMSRRSILEHLVEVQRLQDAGARYWFNKLKSVGVAEESFECPEQSCYYRKLLSGAALSHKISYERTGEIHSLYTN
jgi:transcriptional regulator with XRE-family HTH domain